MNKTSYYFKTKELLADTFTPVNLFYVIRDRYPESALLESSDYHAKDNTKSYIGCSPLAIFSVDHSHISIESSEGRKIINYKDTFLNPIDQLKSFYKGFDIKGLINDFPAGLFGYISYDAVPLFEDIEFSSTDESIPLIHYTLYRYIIEIDHFHNSCRLGIIYNDEEEYSKLLENIIPVFSETKVPQFSFSINGDESSSCTDNEYLEMVKKGKHHCDIGDVFQVVLSRSYQQRFKGDDFNVYRALRSVNPSPYLFYYDFGNFRIMGSSPEAQIYINKDKATIYPIAGTFKRTGDDTTDLELAKSLSEDPKENAEHIMLVDLARNDLSKICDKVDVEVYKDIQFYSHVIHLVSKVTGQLTDREDMLKVVTDTFPAGTLSGAPKYKAMELINTIENQPRGFYGGAIGFMSFDHQFNHAIMIRSILSKDKTLTYRAGAGIVSKSNEEKELQEVHHKLNALRRSIVLAQTIL